MKYKKLGNTDIDIPVIGFGTMGIGGYFNSDSSVNDQHVKIIEQAIDRGMTFLDTAEVYAAGNSEKLVGKAIQGKRDKVFIATKFSPEHSREAEVIKAAEGSLSRLGIDCIDLYQIHWPHPGIPVAETLHAMETLVRAGKVRYMGVSNFSLSELKEAESVLSKNKIVSIQTEYNLFDRSIEKNILPYSAQESMTVIAYCPLDQGKTFLDQNKKTLMESLAKKYEKSVSQIMLNWLIHHKPVIVIPKTLNLEHLKSNATAADFEISADDVPKISETFVCQPVFVSPQRIKVSLEGEGSRNAYQVLADALENKLGFVPSPVELSRRLEVAENLKPVRLVPTKDKSGKYDYDLVEGRIRYWAWVIAHDGQENIPALVRE